MDSSWHGRTLATLAATGSDKARKGFEPLPTGFIQVAYNNIDAVRAAGDAEPRTAAVLLEVLQGEGGIRPSDIAYLQEVRQLCTERGWLLMIDEVQSGIGRTGKWFAHQWADITPDVMTLAKGLAGGVPIGAMLAAGPAAGVFPAGSHGSTFGGGPLVCAAGLAVLDALESEHLLDNAHTVGAYLKAALGRALAGTDGVTEVRGRGLMLGIELARPCGVLALRDAQAEPVQHLHLAAHHGGAVQFDQRGQCRSGRGGGHGAGAWIKVRQLGSPTVHGATDGGADHRRRDAVCNASAHDVCHPRTEPERRHAR
ncbi:hypothetical protein G6F35_012864 [Rhizopus arrhizus]|nr:hypothetical protein G6F35_012864 [Rhizopus arrhizus]